MTRKQPIPIDFLSNKSLTILDKMLFAYLRSMTTNKDRCVNFYSGNKEIMQDLKRGEVILSVSRVANDIGIDRRKVTKSVQRLQKWYNTFAITKKTYGMVITRNNYDSLIKMDNTFDNTVTTQGQHNDNTCTSSNKSDKIVENEKIVIEEKKLYGETGIIKLTDKEASTLVHKYGKKLVRNYIAKIEDYLVNKQGGKDIYPNHYLTIINWCTRDGLEPSKYKPFTK